MKPIFEQRPNLITTMLQEIKAEQLMYDYSEMEIESYEFLYAIITNNIGYKLGRQM